MNFKTKSFEDKPLYCPNCGETVSANFVLCLNCGTVISRKNYIFRSLFISGVIASLASALIYIIILIHIRIFTEHFINPFIFFISLWCFTLLMMKLVSLRRQVNALNIFRSSAVMSVVTEGGGIYVENADGKITEMADILKGRGYFNLLNIVIFDRVRKVLAYLRNVQSKEEINNTLAYQAQIDRDSSDMEFSMISVFYWAIPILGFIGTVLGIGESINSFGGFISGSGANLADAAMRDSLARVASGLSVAFDSTFIALTFAVVIVPFGMYVESRFSDLLGQVEEYCLNFLTPHIIFPGKEEK